MIDIYLCPPLLEKVARRVEKADAGYAAWEKAELERKTRSPAKQRAAARIAFLKSPEWKAARERVFAERGRVCYICEAEATQVDHVKPRSKYPELALSHDNLRPICWPCNKRKAAR